MPDKVTVWNPTASGCANGAIPARLLENFVRPAALPSDRPERLYIADQTNRRVQVFDTSGCFLTSGGESGIGQGQFGGNISSEFRVGGPQFVALDSSGHVYTTEGSSGAHPKIYVRRRIPAGVGR